jgi:hypothetical protein
MPSKSAAAVALPALEKAEVSSYDPKLFHKIFPLPVFDGFRNTSGVVSQYPQSL